MWYERSAAPLLARAARHFPVVVVTGARQVGKSSLVRRQFADHAYISLEVPSLAALAEHDPDALFRQFQPPIIIDEVQYAPTLPRALKTRVDADRHAMGRFVLTGSQKLGLMQGVSESLAGRAAIIGLEGLSAPEIARARPTPELTEFTTRGAMPELWRDEEMPSDLFYSSYLATYLERDVRQLVNVGSLRDFERFVRACAARSGQLLNKSDLARDVGVSPTTAGAWLSVLVASNQVSLLEPWFANVGKRLVKSPKLYLNDTGLLCFLLGVRASDFERTPYAGAIFETLVYAELRKHLARQRAGHTLSYYRDRRNREVDFLLERAGEVWLLDAKLTARPDARDARSLGEVAGILTQRRPHPAITRLQALVTRSEVDHRLSAGGPWVSHPFRLATLPGLTPS